MYQKYSKEARDTLWKLCDEISSMLQSTQNIYLESFKENW